MAIEYVIRIEDGTRQHGSSPVAGASEAAAAPVASDQGDSKRQKAAIGAYISSKALTPAAKSVASYVSSNIGIEFGSSELQQKTDFAIQAASFATKGYNNVKTSMATFSSTSVGIAVGLITTAIGTAVQIGIKQAQINQQAKLEGEQLALYRSRLGAAYNGGRSGGTA